MNAIRISGALAIAFACLVAPQHSPAAAGVPLPAPPPRVVLVLSGGGARGAAHIGVLKVLDEMHVPVDMIVGTSMGSIIGGLYATGWAPGEIEDLLRKTDWSDLLVDRVERDERSFRRKQDDVHFFIPAKLRFKGIMPYLPPGVLGGQKLDLLLKSLEIRSTGERDFDRFPIPYRAVATDIATGEAVVLGHGSLASAMRASMSVPGAFAPVELEGRTLVDGGLAANLPVGIAQSLGAKRIIAVDISSPLTKKEDIRSFLSVFNQQTGFLTVGNRAEDLKRMGPGDVLIQPELGDIGFAEFKRAAETIACGEAAARAAASSLRAFSVDDAEWERYMAVRHLRPESDLFVTEVGLVNDSWVSDVVIRRRLRIETGKPLDQQDLQAQIMRLSGMDYFGMIRHDFERAESNGVLTVRAGKKPYGRNSLQFGLSIEDDFQGDSSYGLSVRHLLLAANRRGGEWVNEGRIGDRAVLSSEFYQPFDPGMRWFVAPAVEYRRDEQSLWSDGERVADLRLKSSEGRIGFGRVFENWGEVRLTSFYANTSGEVHVGPPEISPYSVHEAGLRASFHVDTLSTTVFPRSGVEVRATYAKALDSFGSDIEYDQASLVAGGALRFGREIFYTSVEVRALLDGTATPLSAAYLGGLFRLSGLGRSELIGESSGLARLVYYHEIIGFDLGALSNKLYAGLSLEAGNVHDRGDPITWEAVRYGGSLFVGAESVIGPVYVGCGFADGGRRAVYLVIGDRF